MKNINCPQCGHSLLLHAPRAGGVCGDRKCKCKVVGITVEQAKVLK